MLNEKSKKLIDSMCNTLVAKFPIPQDQVDQITISLIYKFMSNMDEQSVEMGGKKSFLIGEYEKYNWNIIFSNKHGGLKKLELYKEAIQSMQYNQNLPILFRDIFKGASVPLDEPEIFNLFIKDINEFDYSNSENLGNSYEYLLSKTGAQGTLGQFRTPRHIIDFMVTLINPKKNDLIIDPSCGTAGFLISAYKHILNSNCKKQPGDLLTNEERQKLTISIKGYDIEPKMVRTSLVNLYLNGFETPSIDEYDTLSADSKWGEHADVFIANPPFFSPKGGISPNDKFSIKSKKAEVLFVDYIVEHLKPNGKACLIVPEGINFNGNKSYQELRKRLCNAGLVADITLPHGVFKPYASVKTHILIIDKTVSKKMKDILFIEITNDGFTQSDTRKPVNGEQLSKSIKIYKDFISKKNYNKRESNPLSYTIKKENINSSTKYHLLGRWYDYPIRKVFNQKLPFASIGEYCEIKIGLSPNERTKEGKYNFVVPAPEFKTADHFDYNGKCLCVPIVSSAGHGKADMKRLHYIEGKFALASTMISISSLNEEILITKFLYFLFRSKMDELFIPLMKGATNVTLEYSLIDNIKFPLPKIDIQKKFVRDIEDYENKIFPTKKVIEINKKKIFDRVSNFWA